MLELTQGHSRAELDWTRSQPASQSVSQASCAEVKTLNCYYADLTRLTRVICLKYDAS